MNTTMTKKQVFGLITAANYIRTISLHCKKEEFYPGFNPDIVHDTSTYLLALAQELMPEDKEFDQLRNTLEKQISNHEQQDL